MNRKIQVILIAAALSIACYIVFQGNIQHVSQHVLDQITIRDVDQFKADVNRQVSLVKANTIRKRPKIHLTIRMTINEEMLGRIFCYYLRSTALFWSPHYGDVLFILDNTDEPQKLDVTLNSIGLPNKFRAEYEKDFIRRSYIEALGKRVGRPYGYLRMYYSSFIMDWYVGEDDIVAWTDSDTAFSIPVLDESIFRDDRLIVKGINQFDYAHVINWRNTTEFALGLPSITDFMSYFPTYVYARTLRNCRNYIMHRFNATTFEEAYIKMIDYNAYISPVQTIFSYAYYFEKDLYDWHIDISPERTLSAYNAKWVPPQYALEEADIRPDLHVTVHARHYSGRLTVIEQSICYTQIALGMKNISHCDKYRDKLNLQLFEFQSQRTHVNSWCALGPAREYCKKIVDERYQMWVDYYRGNGLKYDTNLIKVIEDFGKAKFGLKCYDIKYVPYI